MAACIADRFSDLVALCLALVVTAPLLAPGYTLTYDMVFTPSPPISGRLLGLAATPPRSVPTGLLVAILSRVLSGQGVQKVVLVGIFALAAAGAARLVPSPRLAARVAAGVLYGWNPFLFERLLLGQWALLLGYACLPWLIAATIRSRREGANALPALLLWLIGTAAASPYTGIIGGVLVLVISLAPPWDRRAVRRAIVLLPITVVANLPWLVPAVLQSPSAISPRLAQELFRARPDSPLGLVGSLASLGGLWRTDLAPTARSTLLWVPAFLAIVGIALPGLLMLRRRWPAGAWVGLLIGATGGFVLAMAPSVPGLRDAMVWMTSHLPGGGVLRDTQKFIMPWAVFLAVGFGLGAERLLLPLGSGARARTLGTAVALLPVALAPTLAWGACGRLAPVSYPRSWETAAGIMSSDPSPGGILVLPWHAYLPFSWNADHPVYDPATMYFRRPVLINGALEFTGATLRAEDPWSREAAGFVAHPSESRMAGLGIRYVLILKVADWRTSLPSLSGLRPVFRAADLELLRGPPGHPPAFSRPAAAPIVAGDCVVLLVLGAAVSSAVRGRVRRYRAPVHLAQGTMD